MPTRNTQQSSGIPLISDLLKIVFGFCEFRERKGWNFIEDTGPYYEEFVTYGEYEPYVHRFVDIVLRAKCPLPNKQLLYLQTLRLIDESSYHILKLKNMPKLHTLKLGFYDNMRLDLQYVPELQKLHLGAEYNQTLDLRNNLKLKTLTLGYYYSRAIDLRMNTDLETLELSLYFNHPLDLTSNLRLSVLDVPLTFNQPIYISQGHRLAINKPELLVFR